MMATLLPPSSGVTVRMYRQGLGDCFLLAFPTATADQAFYMLIDCGVVLGTSDPETIMNQVATDIEAATGGHIHLLVATHEHWDHLSGFLQARPVFERMHIHNIWLAWTEDPADGLASALRGEFNTSREGLRMVASRGTDAELAQALTNILDFFGVASGANTDGALQAIRAFAAKEPAPIRYLRPGDGPLSLPLVGNQSLVSGIQIYVLGPPHDEAALRRVDPTSGEEYGDANALSPAKAFVLGLQDESQLSGDVLRAYTLSCPFDPSLQISKEEASQMEFFQKYYGFGNGDSGARGQDEAEDDGPSWRRIDDDWQGAASNLALQLDSYTNNTSVVLAIELPRTHKVLLFVGDAQVGSWLSWDNLQWQVPGPSGTPLTIRAADLLGRTVLYKVGHHGSHNATIRGDPTGTTPKGLELMTSQDLVAMVPVDHDMAVKKRWGQMPFGPLLKRLQEKTRGRLMISREAPEPHLGDDSVSAVDWPAFQPNYQSTDLYLQYTVMD